MLSARLGLLVVQTEIHPEWSWSARDEKRAKGRGGNGGEWSGEQREDSRWASLSTELDGSFE